MAAKKQSEKSTSHKNGSSAKPIAIALLVIIAAAVIWWFLPNIIKWAEDIWKILVSLLGMGLALIALYIIIFAFIIGLKHGSLLTRQWNKWLGSFALAFALWGLAAFMKPDWG